MAKKIEDIYFVKKEQPAGGQKIKNYLVPNIIPPFVKSGDTFTINNKIMKYDPFPGEQKDLVIIISENNVQSELRFTERGTNGSAQGKKITITIP